MYNLFMNWYLTTIIAIVGFSGANALSRYISTKFSPIFSFPFFVFGSFVFSLIALLFFKIFSQEKTVFSSQGVTIAIIAGIIWAIGQLSFFISLKSAPLSLLSCLIIGGIGIGGVLAGVIFFHETLSFMRIIGIVVILIGSIVLAIS